MPACPTLRTVARLGLPLCGWLSLALFVFIASGLPVPVPYAKDLSRAFPCMFSQCGCRNADQCWQTCCCHTAQFRLDWARDHGIQPPPALVAAAAAEPSTMADVESPAACCAR